MENKLPCFGAPMKFDHESTQDKFGLNVGDIVKIPKGTMIWSIKLQKDIVLPNTDLFMRVTNFVHGLSHVIYGVEIEEKIIYSMPPILTYDFEGRVGDISVDASDVELIRKKE